MPLSSIPRNRLTAHDRIYNAGDAPTIGPGNSLILLKLADASYPPGSTTLSNDPHARVILRAGSGTNFTISSGDANQTTAIYRSIRVEMPTASLSGSGSVNTSRLTAGEIRGSGATAQSLALTGAYTAGDGRTDGTLTFANDTPANLFTVSGVPAGSGTTLVDPSPSAALNVVVNNGVRLKIGYIGYSGTTLIDSGGTLTFGQNSGTGATWVERQVSDVTVNGTLEIYVNTDGTVVNGGGHITVINPSVSCGASGVMSVINTSGSYNGIYKDPVNDNVCWLVSFAYLSSATIKLPTLAGALATSGTVQGNCTVNGTAAVLCAGYPGRGYPHSGGISQLNAQAGYPGFQGNLTVTGGGVLMFANGASALSTIAVTGAFNATSVGEVRFTGYVLFPGTYTLITCGSRTGTLPNPKITGGGMGVGAGTFSHYIYNATSIQMVLT